MSLRGTHISWPQLLPVALRLSAVRAILQSGHRLESLMIDGPARAAIGEFQAVVQGLWAHRDRDLRSSNEAKREGPALDAYFDRVAAEIRSRAALVAPPSALAQVVHNAVLVACGARVCQTCSGAHPCRWTETSRVEDARRMDTRGHCLTAIRELFDWVCQIATQAYEDACESASMISAVLSTGHDARNTELELAINGATYEPFKAKKPRRVHLSVNPETFWVQDYLSVPYVLMHECVAHVCCGIDIASADAALSKNFHDGWMDCVAYYLLRLGLEDGLAEIAPFIDDVEKQSLSVHQLRYNICRQDLAPDVWRWVQGSRAFEALWEVLLSIESATKVKVDLGSASVQSLQRLVTLSLQINASQIGHRERQRFVANVATLCARAETQREPAGRPQVIECATEYLRTRNFDRFVRNVIELK